MGLAMSDTLKKNASKIIGALVYTSTATRQISEEEMQQLLEKARLRNKALNITGLLVYSDGTFMQYLEGPPDNLKEIFETIKLDNRHKGIIEIPFKPTQVRRFTDWNMAYSKDVTKFVGQFIQVE